MHNEIAKFTKHPGLHLYRDYFERGGLLNLDPNAFERDRKDGFRVSDEEGKALERENNPKSRFDRFRQTKGLYLLVALCSAAAAGELRLIRESGFTKLIAMISSGMGRVCRQRR
jgi:hypothetical protein